MYSQSFNALTVSLDLESKAIQFFLNQIPIYDIGLELCLSNSQIDGWIAQLSDKRWIRDNNGLTLFLNVLAASQNELQSRLINH
jgi:hypothetical protein